MNKRGRVWVYVLAAFAVVIFAMVLSALLVLKPYYQGLVVGEEGNNSNSQEAIQIEEDTIGSGQEGVEQEPGEISDGSADEVLDGSSASKGGDIGIESLPGDISSCQIIDYGPGIYTLDTNLTVSSGACFDVIADNVVIDCKGHTINGSSTGIILQNAENVTVKNCNFLELKEGVDIVNSSGSIIENNIFIATTNNSIRLRLNSNNNVIQYNTINYSNGESNIWLETDSGYNIIKYNNMVNGYYGISIQRSSHNTISGNRISIADYGIRIYNSSHDVLDSNIVSRSIVAGIFVNNSRYTKVSYSSSDEDMVGFYVYNSNHTVLDSIFSTNPAGDSVYIVRAVNSTVYNATILGEDDEIWISASRNTNITQSYLEGGIFMENSLYDIISNNTVVNDLSESGIYLFASNHSNILNNSVRDNYEAGIRLVDCTNDSVLFNNLSGNDMSGIFIEDSMSNNVSFNAFSGNKPYHIFVSATSDSGCNNDVANNTGESGRAIKYYNHTLDSNESAELNYSRVSEIVLCNADRSYIENVNSTLGGGFLLIRTSHSTILNSSSNSNPYSLSFYASANNTLERISTSDVQNSSVLLSTSSPDNRLSNFSISSRVSGAYDIEFLDSLNGTVINNSDFEKYNFGALGGRITIENSYGQIRFLRAVNGSGADLSADIKISNNLAYLNSARTGLNKSANITLYGVRTDFARPAILRDGNICPASVCRNFTNLNAGTVVFNVTGWTNYTIGEGYNELTACGNLTQSNTIYRLVQPVSSNRTCFNIFADNITLECMGWSNKIVYGNSTSTISYYGIHSNATQTKVRNCEVTMGALADGSLERYAIYYYGGHNGQIINSNASGNRQGIVVNSSFNNIMGNIANYNSQTGIYLISNVNNSVINNSANNNKFGIRIYWISDNNTMTNNTANNNWDAGIYLGPSADNNYVAFNNASNNTNGIAVVDSTLNRIASNSLDGNEYSLFINGSSSNTISFSKASRNSAGGIYLSGNSNNNILEQNNISLNNATLSSCGICLEGSTGNYIYLNNITGNYYGIKVSGASSNNIYNNYFNNTINANGSGTNNWNTTKTSGVNIYGGAYIGGNYWSDYAGWDMDGDGIGNVYIPHNSSGGIILGGDYLPLTEVNSVPSMIIVIVNSSYGTNFTNENLTCWARADEIDLDNVTYYGRWYKNNILNSSFVSSVYIQGVLVNLSKISSSLTRKGENWSCEVFASDGQYNSSYLGSNITILNSAPYFNPALVNKTTAENSSFYYDVNCSDADNDVLDYAINDSSIFDMGSASGIIDNSMDLFGNRHPDFDDAGIYYYSISCGDGEVNSSQEIMVNITNTNRVPEIKSLVVNSTYGTNGSYENMTCWVNATDADGDNITYVGAWYKDGVIKSDMNFSILNNAQGILVNVSTIDNSSFSIGESMSCNVSAYDGENYSSYIESNDILVVAVCNNSICESGESCSSCPADCGTCPASSGGSGGGGGGIGYDLFTPSDTQLSIGYSEPFNTNDRVMFFFNGDYHYVILESVSGEYANILVQSTPVRFSLMAGEQKKIDIDDDGVYDLLISVTAIRYNAADITVQRIIESVVPFEPAPTPTPEIIEEEKSYSGWILFLLIVIIAIVLASILLLYKKSRNERIEDGIRWVKDAREKGYNNKEINRILHEKGWTRKEIKKIMEHADSRVRKSRH